MAKKTVKKELKRHLRLEIVQKFGVRFLRIAEQTHRLDDFSASTAAPGVPCEYRAENGFTLASHSCPAVDGLDKYLYVRGSEDESDEDLMDVPDNKTMAMLRAAVTEYNMTFGHGMGELVIENIE